MPLDSFIEYMLTLHLVIQEIEIIVLGTKHSVEDGFSFILRIAHSRHYKTLGILSLNSYNELTSHI